MDVVAGMLVVLTIRLDSYVSVTRTTRARTTCTNLIPSSCRTTQAHYESATCPVREGAWQRY